MSVVMVYRREDVHVDVCDCSERRPRCCRADTDYQLLDHDAEEGHRRFGIVYSELGRISRWVWLSGRQRQLLAGTWQGLPSRANGQRLSQSWGRWRFLIYIEGPPFTGNLGDWTGPANSLERPIFWTICVFSFHYMGLLSSRIVS